jgi:hypothetical protein
MIADLAGRPPERWTKVETLLACRWLYSDPASPWAQHGARHALARCVGFRGRDATRSLRTKWRRPEWCFPREVVRMAQAAASLLRGELMPAVALVGRRPHVYARSIENPRPLTTRSVPSRLLLLDREDPIASFSQESDHLTAVLNAYRGHGRRAQQRLRARLAEMRGWNQTR